MMQEKNNKLTYVKKFKMYKKTLGKLKKNLYELNLK